MQIFDKTQTVSGIDVTLNAYTERRREKLDAINKERDEFLKSQTDLTWDELDIKKKASFWQRKAEVLWTPEKPYPAGYFESPDFEYTKLRDTELHFMMTQVYL